MLTKLISVGIAFVGSVLMFKSAQSCFMFFSQFSHQQTQTAPKTLKGERVIEKLFWDGMLILLVIIQHSIMASPAYKKTFGIHLEPVQRSVFNIAACLSIQFLFMKWEYVHSIYLWNLDLSDSPVTSTTLYIIHVAAWIFLLLQHTLLEPLYFIGVKQVYHSIINRVPPWAVMSPRLQKLVKRLPHPGVWSIFVILWATPHMTLDRWLVATVFSWYLCFGTRVTHNDYEYTESQVTVTKHKTTSERSTMYSEY